MTKSRETEFQKKLRQEAEHKQELLRKHEEHKKKLAEQFSAKMGGLLQKTKNKEAAAATLKNRLAKARNHLDRAKLMAVSKKEKELTEKFQKEIRELKQAHAEELHKRNKADVTKLEDMRKLEQYCRKLEEEIRALKVEKVKVSLMHLDREYESVALAMGGSLD